MLDEAMEAILDVDVVVRSVGVDDGEIALPEIAVPEDRHVWCSSSMESRHPAYRRPHAERVSLVRGQILLEDDTRPSPRTMRLRAAGPRLPS